MKTFLFFPILLACPSCPSLLPVPHARHSYLFLMPVLYVLPCCPSLMPVPPARPLCPSLLPVHYARLLCPSLVLVPPARPLCPSILPVHYTLSLCPSLLPVHYARLLCPSLMPVSYARPSCPSIMPVPYARSAPNRPNINLSFSETTGGPLALKNNFKCEGIALILFISLCVVFFASVLWHLGLFISIVYCIIVKYVYYIRSLSV